MIGTTLIQTKCDDLKDALAHAQTMRDIASGATETLTGAEVDAYLAAPTPLAFWRRHRGLTQTQLATQAGLTQPFLAQAENGRRGLSVASYARIAKALRLRIEDLLPET